MYLIEDILVSDPVLEARFACNIQACKGACCWEGDFGAPLEMEEVLLLESLLPELRPFLTPEGREVLDQQGAAVHYDDLDGPGTPLRANGACAYLTLDAQGVSHCGIEQAWAAGVTDFRKPISCHLYPIRVTGDREKGYEGLNYHEWSICKAACTRGEQEGILLIDFAREALIRRYGESFYEALKAAATERRDG